MADLAAEPSHWSAGWPAPVQYAQMRLAFSTAALIDNARTYGLHFAGGPVPLLSHFVAARAALDAAASGWWLVGDEMSVDTLVLRGQVLRLANALEQKKSPPQLGGAREHADKVIAQVRAGASHLGHAVSAKSLRIGGEELPSTRKAFQAMLGYPNHPQISDGLWWWLSGYTHASLYALLESTGDLPDPNSLGLPMVELVTQSEAANLIGAVVAKALVRVVAARAGYYGLSSPRWDEALHLYRPLARDHLAQV